VSGWWDRVRVADSSRRIAGPGSCFLHRLWGGIIINLKFRLAIGYEYEISQSFAIDTQLIQEIDCGLDSADSRWMQVSGSCDQVMNLVSAQKVWNFLTSWRLAASEGLCSMELYQIFVLCPSVLRPLCLNAPCQFTPLFILSHFRFDDFRLAACCNADSH
jgi:hypothetical protein